MLTFIKMVSLLKREKVNRKDENGFKARYLENFTKMGELKVKPIYKDDLLNGPYKEYDENGNVKVYCYNMPRVRLLEKRILRSYGD